MGMGKVGGKYLCKMRAEKKSLKYIITLAKLMCLLVADLLLRACDTCPIELKHGRVLGGRKKVELICPFFNFDRLKRKTLLRNQLFCL